jgi:hypothetical protein
MEQPHESPDLGKFVEMQLIGFKKLFKALLSREDNQKDDGHSVTESSFMRLMQPITANYAQRSDVAEIYNNILLLEHQSGSRGKGLSLQGLIAAISKVALEVFNKVEWQSRFPTSKDKLRLLLFLIDNGQSFFKDHYKILQQKTTRINSQNSVVARSRSGSSTRGIDAPLPGTWKDAHYEASLIAVAQGAASSVNAYKGLVQSTPGGHDAVFKPQRPTSPLPRNTPRMKSDMEYNAAALKRAEILIKNAEIDNAPILLSPGIRGRQATRPIQSNQVQNQNTQQVVTQEALRPVENLNLSIDELEDLLSVENEDSVFVDKITTRASIIPPRAVTLRSTLHSASNAVTLDEFGSSFVAPFSGLDTSAVSVVIGNVGDVNDHIVSSSSSSSTAAVASSTGVSMYATAIDGINFSISKGLDRVLQDSRESRLEIAEKRSLLASRIGGNSIIGGGELKADKSENALITSRIHVADRSNILSKTREEALPVLFRDAKAGGVRLHHAPVFELNNVGEEDPFSILRGAYQQSGQFYNNNVDLNAESNTFLQSAINSQPKTSSPSSLSSSSFLPNKQLHSTRVSSMSVHNNNTEPLSEDDLRAPSSSVFFGSSLRKTTSSFQSSRNQSNVYDNEGRIPPGISRAEFETHLRSTSSSSLSSSSLLTNLVTPNDGRSIREHDDADGIGGLAASQARAAAFEKSVQNEANNSATVHNALVLAGAQAFPDVAPGRPAVLVHHGVTGHGLLKRPDARGILSLVNNRPKESSINNPQVKSGAKGVLLSPVNFSTTQSILDGVPSAGHINMHPLSGTMIQNIFASTGFHDKALFSGDSKSASSAATKGMACSAFAIHLQRSSALVKELFNHYAHFGVHSHSKIDRLPGGFIAKINDASEKGVPRMRQNAFTKFILDAGILGRGVIGSNGVLESNQSFRHGDIAVVFSMAMARMASTESAISSGLIPKGSVFARPEGFSNINLLLGHNDAAPVSLTLWKTTGFTTRNVKRSMLSLGLDFPAFAHALLLCAVKRFCGRDVQILTAQGGAAALEAERKDKLLLKEYLSGGAGLSSFKGVPVNPTVELQLLLAAAVNGDEDALKSIQLTSTDPLIAKNVSPTLAFRLLLLRHVLPLCVHTGYLSSISEVQITRATELHDFLVNSALPGEDDDNFLPKIAQKKSIDEVPKSVFIATSAALPPTPPPPSALTLQPQLQNATRTAESQTSPSSQTQTKSTEPTTNAETVSSTPNSDSNLSTVVVPNPATITIVSTLEEKSVPSPSLASAPSPGQQLSSGSPSLMHALLSPTRMQAQLHRSNSGIGLLGGFMSSSSSSSSSSATKTGLNSLLYGKLPSFSVPTPLVEETLQDNIKVVTEIPIVNVAINEAKSPMIRSKSPLKQMANVVRLSTAKSPSPSPSPSPTKRHIKGVEANNKTSSVKISSPVASPSPHLLQSIRHMEKHKSHDYHKAAEAVLGHVRNREKERHWSPNNNVYVASKATERSPSPTKLESVIPAPHSPHLMNSKEYHIVVEDVLGHVISEPQYEEEEKYWHMNNNERVAAVATERLPSPYHDSMYINKRSPRVRAVISPLARQAAENVAKRVPLRMRRSFRGVQSPNQDIYQTLDKVSENTTDEFEYEEDITSPTFRFRGMGPALFAAAGVRSEAEQRTTKQTRNKQPSPRQRQIVKQQQPPMDANERRRDYNMRRGSIPMSLGSYDSSGTGMEEDVEVLYTSGSYITLPLTNPTPLQTQATVIQKEVDEKQTITNPQTNIQQAHILDNLSSPRAEEAAYMLLELQQPSEQPLLSDLTSPDANGTIPVSTSPRSTQQTASVQWRADVGTPPPASRIVLPGSLPTSPISDNVLSPNSETIESPRLLSLPEETQMRSPEGGSIDAAAVLASLATPAGRMILADSERNIPSTERAQRIWQRQFEGGMDQQSVDGLLAQSPAQSHTQQHAHLSSSSSSALNSPTNPHADVSTFGALFAASPPGPNNGGTGAGGVGDRYEIRPAIGAETPGAQIAVPVRDIENDHDHDEVGSGDSLMPLNTFGKNRDNYGQTKAQSSSSSTFSTMSAQQRIQQGRSTASSSSSSRSSQSSVPFRISVHSGGVHIDGGVGGGTLFQGEEASQVGVGSSATTSILTSPLNFGETPAPIGGAGGRRGGEGGGHQSYESTTIDRNREEVTTQQQTSPPVLVQRFTSTSPDTSNGLGKGVQTVVRLHRSGSVEITTSSSPQHEGTNSNVSGLVMNTIQKLPVQQGEVNDEPLMSQVSTSTESIVMPVRVMESIVSPAPLPLLPPPLPTVSTILSSLRV